MNNIYVYLGIYIAILLIISYIISRKQDEEDFLISGRNRGSLQILSSKFAGAIGAGYFITYTGFAYEYGLGVYAMLIGIVIGYLLFAFWAAPKIQKDSKKQKFYTMGDFVYSKTKNKFTLHLTNILSNVILFAWLIVGIVGGAKIINDFGLLSYEVAVLATVLVILIYIFLAGFKAVIITDVIQSIIILALLFIVTFSIAGTTSFPELFNIDSKILDPTITIAFFLFGLIAIFSYSNMYQLCYAAKNRKTLTRGLSFAIIPVMIVCFFLLIIGLFMAKHSPGLDSTLIFTEALKTFLPASLLPLGIVLFFAGIMSSADTNIYAISSHHVMSKRNTQLSPIKSIRQTTIILMIITTIIALIFRDIVDVSIFAGGISLTLSFPMIYLFLGGKNKKRFIGSTIGGLTGLILGIIIFGIEPATALPTLLLGLLGLLWNFSFKRS